MSKHQIDELHRRMDEMAQTLMATRTNVDWLMRFFWIVAASSVGAAVTSLLTLLK